MQLLGVLFGIKNAYFYFSPSHHKMRSSWLERPRGKVRTCSGAGLLVPASVVVRGRVWRAGWALSSITFWCVASGGGTSARFGFPARTQRRPAYVETGTNSTGDEKFGRQIPINHRRRGTRPQPPTNKTGGVGALQTRRGLGRYCGWAGRQLDREFLLPFLSLFRIKNPSARLCWHVLLAGVGFKQYYKQMTGRTAMRWEGTDRFGYPARLVSLYSCWFCDRCVPRRGFCVRHLFI